MPIKLERATRRSHIFDTHSSSVRDIFPLTNCSALHYVLCISRCCAALFSFLPFFLVETTYPKFSCISCYVLPSHLSLLFLTSLELLFSHRILSYFYFREIKIRITFAFNIKRNGLISPFSLSIGDQSYDKVLSMTKCNNHYERSSKILLQYR